MQYIAAVGLSNNLCPVLYQVDIIAENAISVKQPTGVKKDSPQPPNFSVNPLTITPSRGIM
jgi:hypothetical protein